MPRRSSGGNSWRRDRGGRLRFLLDENVPLRLLTAFRGLGFDARHLAEGDPRGLPDEDVIRLAADEERILVTQDLDFGRLYYFHHRGEVGVLVLRLSRLTFRGMEDRIRQFLERVDLGARGLQRALIVLEPHRHRVLR